MSILICTKKVCYSLSERTAIFINLSFTFQKAKLLINDKDLKTNPAAIPTIYLIINKEEADLDKLALYFEEITEYEEYPEWILLGWPELMK